MNDLFPAPALSREAFGSNRLSLVPVIGDAMLPTLRGGRDYVLAAPCDRFLYDAVYVIEDDGLVLIYRFQGAGPGKVLLLRDSAQSSGEHDYLPLDWFNEHVVGIVVCDLKVRDPDLIRKAWEGRR